MNNYEINEETMAVISTAKGKTKIIEEYHEYQINCDAYEVMDESCKYFGSSYTGRVSGAKKMLGYEYKVPIIVEESKQMIFFPTISPQAEGCCWISLKHFQSLQETAGKTQIQFKNGYRLPSSISKASLDNQVLRSTRLESVLNSRKKA